MEKQISKTKPDCDYEKQGNKLDIDQTCPNNTQLQPQPLQTTPVQTTPTTNYAHYKPRLYKLRPYNRRLRVARRDGNGDSGITQLYFKIFGKMLAFNVMFKTSVARQKEH